MLKKILGFILYAFLIIIGIPVIINYLFFYNKNIVNASNIKNTKIEDISNSNDVINNVEFEDLPTQNIEISQFKTSDYLEDYIVGVVSAEMPISFEFEALKAQAVAGRTYTVNHVSDINNFDYNDIGQAYINIDTMKKNWGKNFENNYKKVRQAVDETRGILMYYDGEPIEAVFHSTSGGMTEVAENIWGANLPYIKTVKSYEDEQAPNFLSTVEVKNSDFIKKILKKYPKLNKNKIISTLEINSRSSAGYVLSIKIDKQTISARDIRLMFGLRSTNFTIEKLKDSIKFTTKGYGHGAGMSQYGANFMAKSGIGYKDILNHYYVGVTIR